MKDNDPLKNIVFFMYKSRKKLIFIGDLFFRLFGKYINGGRIQLIYTSRIVHKKSIRIHFSI